MAMYDNVEFSNKASFVYKVNTDRYLLSRSSGVLCFCHINHTLSFAYMFANNDNVNDNNFGLDCGKLYVNSRCLYICLI